MRKIIFAAFLLATAASASAQVHVKGYMRSNGTYVAPYVRTAPDHSIFNNYSTAPNVNPYTGHVGTVNPYSPSNNFGAPQTQPPSAQPCYYNCPR